MPNRNLSKQHVTLACESQDVVGESPAWDERTGSLVWIDIIGKQIHRLQLASQTHDV